jgi:hypothetical protein
MAASGYFLGSMMNNANNTDCDCDCDCSCCLPSCCNGSKTNDNAQMTEILQRNYYPQDVVKAVLNRDSISDDGIALIRWKYREWLDGLTAATAVISAYDSIKDLPALSGELKKILHETAQVRYIELLNQHKEEKQEANVTQQPPEEKLASSGSKEFLKNPRFRFSCFSTTTTPAITLFQQLQQKKNINEALKAKKDEVTEALTALRASSC